MGLSLLNQYLNSHNVKLTTSEKKGKTIIATAYHDRGSIILTSQPLGMVSVSDDYCQNCFRQTSKNNNNSKTYISSFLYPPSIPTPLLRCSKCKSAYFCHQDCFKSAWLSYHQYTCGDDDIRNCDEELLERVLLNIIRYKNHIKDPINSYPAFLTTPSTTTSFSSPYNIDNNNNDNDDGGVDDQPINESIHITMEAFSLLQDHIDNQPYHIIEQFSDIAAQVLNRPYIYEEAVKHQITIEDVIRLQSLFQCNGMSIQDDHLFVVGEGIYPVASFLNHSCRPNAAIVFDGALATIRALEPIQPNEEITISYVDSGRSKGYRQRILRDRYFFNCDCARCHDQGWLRLLDKMVGEHEDDEDEDILNINKMTNSNNNKKKLFSSLSTTVNKKKINQLITLKKHIQHWDLLTLSRQYNRLQNIHPDPTKPLTLGTFTHHMLQFFTPYIWSINNPHLQYTNSMSSSPSPSSSMLKTNSLSLMTMIATTTTATTTTTTAAAAGFSPLSSLLSMPNPSPTPITSYSVSSSPVSFDSTLLSDDEEENSKNNNTDDDYEDEDDYVFFDDPTPENAQPTIQPTYEAILIKAMETCLSFPQQSQQSQQQYSQQQHINLLPSTTFMDGMTSIPVFRISTLIGVNRLFYEAMTDQDWPFAVKCGLYILIQYCFLYPAYHPIMAHHLIMLAKTGWNFIVQDSIREKVYARGVWRWITLAKETCKVAFGVNGCQYKEALYLEWLFKREQQQQYQHQSVFYPSSSSSSSSTAIAC